MVEIAFQVVDIDAHLSYLQEIVQCRNSHTLYRNDDLIVRSRPNVSKPTKGKYLIGDLDIFCYPQAIWQQSVTLSEPPQHEEECALLCGSEVALFDTLTRSSEAAKRGETQTATYVVQSLNAQFGCLESQIKSESPAILIDHDLSQGPDSFGLAGSVGNILP